MAIPGVGPVVAAGWLAATAVGAVGGAVVGGAAGGIIGAMTNAGARSALPAVPRAEPCRAHRLHHLGRREGAAFRTSRSRIRSARPDRLGEVARPRARPAGHHRQLRRARTDRHPAHDRALRRGRPARRRARRRSRSAASAARASSATSFASSPPTGPRTSPARRSRSTAAAPRAAVRRLHRRPAPRRRGRPARRRARALGRCPSNEYIFLPDRAHPVAPLVTVQGGHDPTQGGVYFVDVIVRKATILERLFGGLHEGADLYPASEIDPPGVEQRPAQHDRPPRTCSRSQQIAAAVALRALGRKVDRACDRRADRRGRARAARRRQARARRRDHGHQRQARHGARPASRRDEQGARSAASSVHDPAARQATLIETMQHRRRRPTPRRADRRRSPRLEPAIDIHLPIHVTDRRRATSAGRPQGSHSRSR